MEAWLDFVVPIALEFAAPNLDFDDEGAGVPGQVMGQDLRATPRL